MNRDRTGDLIDDSDLPDPPPPHECHNGWLPTTDPDHPRPCLTCKPWLVHRAANGAQPRKAT
jgi:hypothetical protein